MWCPKCKCEYVEGITECPDCLVPLVETLEEAQAETDTEENTAEGEAETEGETSEEAEGLSDEVREHEKPEYRPLEDKANDLRTSGYTLLIVGAVGVAVLLLIAAGVFPVGMAGIMKYISYAVMGTLFIVFVVSGVHSLIKAKNVAEDAVRENEKRDEIMEWFINEYDGDKIDAAVNSDAGDNDLYYDRVDFMKDRINERFMDLDEGFTADMIERIYTELFDDE